MRSHLISPTHYLRDGSLYKTHAAASEPPRTVAMLMANAKVHDYLRRSQAA